MTVKDTLLALLRQWLLVLVGAGLTATGALAAGRTETVYWSQTTVRFVPPKIVGQGVDANTLVTSTEALIAFAGLVYEDLDVPERTTVSSLGPHILDVGIYDGTWIRLPDSGGQWSHTFGDAILDVQVSGRQPDDVRARTEEAIASIDRAVGTRQAGMLDEQRVGTEVTPPTPTLLVSHAAAKKPMLLAGMLGMLVTVSVAVFADGRRWAPHRVLSRRHPAATEDARSGSDRVADPVR